MNQGKKRENFPKEFSLLLVKSPLGEMTLWAEGGAITLIRWGDHRVEGGEQRSSQVLDLAAVQIGEYFAGARRQFDFPVKMVGTPFQLRVWEELLKIPWGEMRSYGEIARAIGHPKAARAVGGACHLNRLILAIPCHRVVGSSGRLTGYRGGLKIKESLLKWESAFQQL